MGAITEPGLRESIFFFGADLHQRRRDGFEYGRVRNCTPRSVRLAIEREAKKDVHEVPFGATGGIPPSSHASRFLGVPR